MSSAAIGFEMIVFLVIVALAFDFMNGFHDAANSIATVVSTRVLRPHWAVAWAAFFNFIAFLVFGLHVANTIGTGVIEPWVVDHYVIFGALSGAIVWNVITWYYGLPSSSSHALIGGLAGAAVAKGGIHTLVGKGFLTITLAIVASPMFGFLLGMLLMTSVAWMLFHTAPHRVDRWFRRLQFVSASLYSLGHGGNDAQKTMGIIAMLLFASGSSGPTFHVPFWVVIACQAAMALGTLAGGWRIVKTMGMRITKLKPVGGFCAETGGAITLFAATGLGIPVSTTHTITGAIIGVGAVNKLSAVRWGVAQRIVWAWVLTIPCSAFISAVAWWLASHFAER
jgi:PiT family inorganic phosphate transporter